MIFDFTASWSDGYPLVKAVKICHEALCSAGIASFNNAAIDITKLHLLINIQFILTMNESSPPMDDMELPSFLRLLSTVTLGLSCYLCCSKKLGSIDWAREVKEDAPKTTRLQ